jgi:hypothetical protein
MVYRHIPDHLEHRLDGSMATTESGSDVPPFLTKLRVNSEKRLLSQMLGDTKLCSAETLMNGLHIL